jgi:NitT/TauT family transport system permease protein
MKKEQRTQILWSLSLLGGFVFFLLAWWLLSWGLENAGNHLLPTPWATLGRLAEVLFDPNEAQTTWVAVGYTFLRLLIGFALSFLLGAFFGTLAGLFPYFRAFNGPFIVFCRTVPTAAIVLLLTGIFFGADYQAWAPFIPCFLVFMVVYPLVYEAYVSGISAESQDEKDALALEGGKNFYAIIHVYWPDSENYVLLALAQGLGLAMKVSIMSEILVGSNSKAGLGELIRYSRDWLNMDYLLAYSLIAVVMIAIVDLFVHYAKKELKKSEE